MISEALIIMSSMRGGYVNVGSTVHTLFRMNRRPFEGCKPGGNSERISHADSGTAAVAKPSNVEATR
jgi:hypothetical protein